MLMCELSSVLLMSFLEELLKNILYALLFLPLFGIFIISLISDGEQK